jgi:hypothetical protein
VRSRGGSRGARRQLFRISGFQDSVVFGTLSCRPFCTSLLHLRLRRSEWVHPGAVPGSVCRLHQSSQVPIVSCSITLATFYGIPNTIRLADSCRPYLRAVLRRPEKRPFRLRCRGQFASVPDIFDRMQTWHTMSQSKPHISRHRCTSLSEAYRFSTRSVLFPARAAAHRSRKAWDAGSTMPNRSGR